MFGVLAHPPILIQMAMTDGHTKTPRSVSFAKLAMTAEINPRFVVADLLICRWIVLGFANGRVDDDTWASGTWSMIVYIR